MKNEKVMQAVGGGKPSSGFVESQVDKLTTGLVHPKTAELASYMVTQCNDQVVGQRNSNRLSPLNSRMDWDNPKLNNIECIIREGNTWWCDRPRSSARFNTQRCGNPYLKLRLYDPVPVT